MFKLKLVLLLVTTMFISCGDDASPGNDNNNSEESLFVSATETSTIDVQTLKAFAAGFGQQDIASLLQYGVKTYNFIYKTNYNDTPIEASGLLLVPSGITSAAPIVSVQHGTTFEKDGAPSVSGSYTGVEFFASAGYISLVPDFIGYGSSADIFHPYYDKEHSAGAVIDMVKAAKEFLTKEKIAFNDQLFLAGYSEGGYVTLAAAEELNRNPDHQLAVTAVAAGAGGYDLNQMLQGVATETYYSYPAYLAFVIMSYNTTYEWNKPLTYFFQDKYAQALQQYMNGEYGGSTINANLTTDLTKLFNPDFYARLKQPDGELELKQATASNSVQGWKTDVPIRLYHGTKDEIIPYQNSETTLASFKNAGSEDVSLTLIQNGTHGSSFIPMMRDFIPWFVTLKSE